MKVQENYFYFGKEPRNATPVIAVVQLDPQLLINGVLMGCLQNEGDVNIVFTVEKTNDYVAGLWTAINYEHSVAGLLTSVSTFTLVPGGQLDFVMHQLDNTQPYLHFLQSAANAHGYLGLFAMRGRMTEMPKPLTY